MIALEIVETGVLNYSKTFRFSCDLESKLFDNLEEYREALL